MRFFPYILNLILKPNDKLILNRVTTAFQRELRCMRYTSNAGGSRYSFRRSIAGDDSKLHIPGEQNHKLYMGKATQIEYVK